MPQPTEANNPSLPKEADASLPILHMARITTRSGPLPTPEQLKAYEEVLPGAAKAIFDFALTEQKHRHATEDSINQGNLEAMRVSLRRSFMGDMAGIGVGALVCLVAISVSAYVGLHGVAAVGVAIATISLAGVVRAFTGKK
jgi:uncharacterized membrane protein